ncbi:MAG: flagellar hook-basal body complex protein FliE [Desulfobacterales bacterium]
MNLDAIGPYAQAGGPAGMPATGAPPAAAAQGGGAFGRLLAESLEGVDGMQREAERAVEDLTIGRQQDVHAVMIAVEKAGIALELALQIRNKLLNAYETLMRQQI